VDMNDGRGGSNEKTSSGTEIAIEIEDDANVLMSSLKSGFWEAAQKIEDQVE
jgi:hypothetical protein